jgi:hypothetical protein
MNSLGHLAIAITFFYNEERLDYLRQICQHHKDLALRTSTFLVTNTDSPRERDLIRQAIGSTDCEILTPTLLGHPFLLTWCHREIFRMCLINNQGYTHFMYTEDDILVRRHNIQYWLEGLDILSLVNCIPGFVRYEIDAEGKLNSTDITEPADFETLPKVVTPEGYNMVNLQQPYQGMYLLTRDMMEELLSTEANSPDFGIWGIREKAAQGLTFWNVPIGAYSRQFVGVDAQQKLDPRALIHHIPNNYANDTSTNFGKLRISQIFKQ